MAPTTQHKTLAAALVAAQLNFPPITRDAVGQVGLSRKYKYATLASTLDAILRPLNDEGISVTQPTRINDVGGMVLVTTLTHAASGETLEGEIPLPFPEDWQRWGSALTYARRYGLTALCGVTPEDEDDGASAQGFTRDRNLRPARQPDPGAETQAVERARERLLSARRALKAAVEDNGFEQTQVQDLLVNAMAFAPDLQGVQFDTDGRINVNKLVPDALEGLAKVINEHVDELKAGLGVEDHLPEAVEVDKAPEEEKPE